MMLTIRHLYLSPGHNFYGRHGQEPDTHPLRKVEEAECVAGRGLVGDRFFDYKENFKGQITFFDWATYQELLPLLTGPDPGPSAFRRNVILEGIDLNTLIGRTFGLQNLRFEGIEECRPCYWMDQAFAPGTEDALQGRGGLRARILTDGMLRTGPAALQEFEQAPSDPPG